jgi:cytochrome P450
MNSGKLPFKIKELHDIYGPIVRISANELSFNDPRAWKDIYSRKDMLRPPQFRGRAPGVEAHNLISAPAADHARFRKALSPAFSEKATREYEPVVRRYFEKLMERFDAAIEKESLLPKKRSATVDIVEWFNFATFDIIGEVTLSKGFGCLETGAGHASMDVLLHFQAIIIAVSIQYYPWLDAVLAQITPKSAFRALENVFQDGRQRLRDRMGLKKKEGSHPDVIDFINSHNEKVQPQERLSDAEIEQNVLTIVVAGSETLTTVFLGVFHYLLAVSSKEKLDRLLEEIRSSFNSEAEITGASTPATNLPYLNAVIEEIIRLCPPIPDALRRDVPSSGPATIAGRVIPPGTTVSVSCYSMFRSPSHYENPETFEPERWLQGKDYPAFQPVGFGSHNCLGQPLARLEMRLALALLLFRFNFSIPENVKLKGWLEQKVYWTWEKQPLMVDIIRARH